MKSLEARIASLETRHNIADDDDSRFLHVLEGDDYAAAIARARWEGLWIFYELPVDDGHAEIIVDDCPQVHWSGVANCPSSIRRFRLSFENGELTPLPGGNWARPLAKAAPTVINRKGETSATQVNCAESKTANAEFTVVLPENENAPNLAP